MDWFTENRLLVISLSLMGLGVWWLMPSSWPRSRAGGWLLTLVGGGLLASQLHVATGPLAESILFWIFSVAALLCAVLMITSRKPVYAALWFALVTFSTCGLFLLQSAPFLAAATIIVYAGAIIVTFLFVMMLAAGYTCWVLLKFRHYLSAEAAMERELHIEQLREEIDKLKANNQPQA